MESSIMHMHNIQCQMPGMKNATKYESQMGFNAEIPHT